MPFQAAFYTGTKPGIPGVYNRLVRKRGRGLYSHVELVFSDGMWGSSSFMDGGVHLRPVKPSADWHYIDLPPELEDYARKYIEDRIGRGYDIMGNVHLTIGFVSNDPIKEFCSEIAAGALQLPESWRFEPNALAAVLGHHYFRKAA